MRVRIFQSIAICGLLAVGVLTAWAFAPETRRAPEPRDPGKERAWKLVNWNHQKVCPAGHETEIVMAQMHLHVDMRLIARLEFKGSQEVPDGCPTGPILAQSMSFDHIGGTKDFDALLVSRGLPLNHLDLDVGKWATRTGFDTSYEHPTSRIVVEGLGAIDDISSEFSLSSPSKRYRLEYASVTSDSMPRVIVMLCHGDVQKVRWRYCETFYEIGDIKVSYQFRQETDFPHSHRQQAPVREPNGFMAVDMGVRTWIGEMLRSEGGTQ